MKKTLLSWSSGKDSAWALYALKQMPDIELVGLFSTYNQEFERIAMHSTRLDLVRMQAKLTGLPIELIPLPFPCSNEDYEQIMGAFTKSVIERGITHIAFGDLFLKDVTRKNRTRAWRRAERRLLNLMRDKARELRDVLDQLVRGFGHRPQGRSTSGSRKDLGESISRALSGKGPHR